MLKNRPDMGHTLIISHTTRAAERKTLGLFSLLSVCLHTILLAITLFRTGEMIRIQPPVRLITVELGQMESPSTRVLPRLVHPSKISETHQSGQAPIPPAARPQLSPSAQLIPDATATTVTDTHQESKSLPSVMPVRESIIKPGPVLPAALPAPSASPIPHTSRPADISSIRASYMQRCRSMIEHYKEYPVMARKGMIEGTVLIRGTLARDGLLRQCSVTRPSGSSLLDKAALRAVQSVDRFPPVPLELHGNELAFEVPVSFRLSTK